MKTNNTIRYICPRQLFAEHYTETEISDIGLGIAIRYAIAKSILDGTDIGPAIYKKYKSYRTVKKFEQVVRSMNTNGYNEDFPILIFGHVSYMKKNKFLQVLNGSHRLACSLLFNMKVIPMQCSFSSIEETEQRWIQWYTLDNLHAHLTNHKKGYTSEEVDLIIDTVNILTQ